MSNTEREGAERIVSVTAKGQATIPKPLREKHGISAPGRVKFIETDDGEIVVRPVGSMREFRGLAREGDDTRPATEVLREERDREAERTARVVDHLSDDDQ